MTHEEQREELSKRIEELTDELENLQDEYDGLEEAQESASISDYTDDELLEELKNRRMDTVTVVVENLQQKELLLDYVHKFIWTSVNDRSTKVF